MISALIILGWLLAICGLSLVIGGLAVWLDRRRLRGERRRRAALLAKSVPSAGTREVG